MLCFSNTKNYQNIFIVFIPMFDSNCSRTWSPHQLSAPGLSTMVLYQPELPWIQAVVRRRGFPGQHFFQKNMSTLSIVKYDCWMSSQIRLKLFRWTLKIVGFQDTGLRVAEPYPPRKTTTRLAPCFFRHLLMALNLHRRELSGFSRM